MAADRSASQPRSLLPYCLKKKTHTHPPPFHPHRFLEEFWSLHSLAFVLAKPCCISNKKIKPRNSQEERSHKQPPQMFTSSPVAEGVLIANPPNRTLSSSGFTVSGR